MESNVSSSRQSELDQDNSSLQNPSTNPAEAGTTDETRDEDHETSSIEALNWSEVEEEELAAAQQAEALAKLASSSSQGKAAETKVNDKADAEGSGNNNGSSTAGSTTTVVVNDEGNVLSTTLLQSINSSVSDEDPKARKLSVIENWASEVTNAVERGEIEMGEDFPVENGVTGEDDDEEEEEEDEEDVEDEEEEEEDVGTDKGVRRRKGKKKVTPEMVSSLLSNASNGESSVDPLSNAPVLDDGPIWNKGPRSYTFQENRRINQKLTFCLLIVVVLAIGLGLGNLVAHQECEAEFKASQKSQQTSKPVERSPIHAGTIPTTTTPSPIIPDRSTDSTLPNKRSFSSLASKREFANVDEVDDEDDEQILDENFKTTKESRSTIESKKEFEDEELNRVRRRSEEPIIDPKYRVHAETLSKVVNTLDRLSQKIDKFENNTRKLQGVLMIPDEEEKDKTSLYDEEIHKDDGNLEKEEPLDDEEEEKEDEMALIDELIDAIEQTPDYLEMKKAEKQWEEFEKRREEREAGLPKRKSIFADMGDPVEERDLDEINTIVKYVKQYKEFQRRFVKQERKKMREEGKYHRLDWRLPEEYSAEEKNALNVRYKASWNSFLKLLKEKDTDPIQTLFGDEEEEEERTYADVFYYPFADPDDDLTDKEAGEVFFRNAAEVYPELKKIKADLENGESNIPNSVEHAPEVEPEVTVENDESVQSEPLSDDLIILEPAPTQKEVKAEEGKQAGPSSGKEGLRETLNTDKFESVQRIVETEQVKSKSSGKLPAETTPKESFTSEASTLSEDASSNEVKRSEKVKRDVSSDSAPQPPTTKPKRTGSSPQSPTTDNIEIGGKNAGKMRPQGQNESGKNNGRRDQKQKEQKIRQGKQKTNSKSMNKENVEANFVQGKKGKSSKNSNKKFKGAESNKAFENVKGKNNEKRRGSSTVAGKENLSAGEKSSRRAGSGSPKESTNGRGDTYSVPTEKLKTKQKPNRNNNNSNNNNNGGKVNRQNQNNNYRQKQSSQQDQQRQQRRENLKMKHEAQDLSSKETQYRQQRQEFNTNYGSRGQQGQSGDNFAGKKSKSKEKSKGKSRERTSSWAIPSPYKNITFNQRMKC